MIYFFKGCEAACASCGKACDESCKVCSNTCCAPCDICCASICNVLNRPLGCYVLLTVALNVPAGVCDIVSLTEPEVTHCEVAPLAAFCITNLALAVVNIAFAVYLQRRLVLGLQSELRASGRTTTTQLTSKELLDRAGHVVLYDVGFCLYLIIFFGSFGVYGVGFGWAAACAPPTALPWVSAGLLMFYNVLVLNFACLWVCAMACAGCCAGLFGRRTTSTGQVENQGLARLIFGKTGAVRTGSAAAGAVAVAAPSTPPAYATPAPSAPTASEIARGQPAPPLQEMGARAAPHAADAGARPMLLGRIPAVDAVIIGDKP